VTSGSGESRGLRGGPLFEGGQAAGTSRSTTGRPDKSHRPMEPRTSTATVVPDRSGPAAKPRPAMTVGTAAAAARRKGGRRARLTVKRIDPWTTLKFSFVYGVAGMVVLLVAVVVLYGLVDAMGVIGSLRDFLGSVSNNGSGGSTGLAAWLNFDRVLLLAFLIGLVNVVLFTAFATLTAFIYNVCTDIVGGVEVTLQERS